MGLYNFKKRFVPFIESGEKTHTIRAIRKTQDKPGDLMHLYTGLRRPDALLIFRAPCLKVENIEIHGYSPAESGDVLVDGIALSKDEREALALRDGFRWKGGFTAWFFMLDFWERTHALPFKGCIFHWDYARRMK